MKKILDKSTPRAGIMSESKFEDLQKATAKVSESVSAEDKIRCLNRAFELFSEETARLERAYASLKDQFVIVNSELEETNARLHRKVNELDVISAYLDSILTNIAQGLLFIDVNGSVTTYNKAAEKLLGVASDKVLFQKFSDNFTDELFGFSMSKALQDLSCPRHMVIVNENAADQRRYLEIDTTIVEHEQEKVSEDVDSPIDTLRGVIVLIRDITTVRSLQQLAERNDRMKELGEMAAMVAHEIRNPLGGIKGFASLLRRDLESDPAKTQMIDHIIEGTDILNRLVTNVLNYSRPLEIHTEQIDLVALLKSVETHFLADEKFTNKFKLVLDIPMDSFIAAIDQQYYKTCLLNLILNGTQAMSDGGTITLRLREKNGNAIVDVVDNGVGIAPENMEKIFSPFFTTKEEGNGFGLTEVHKVIASHGGRIDVQSVIGQGSTFTIRTPITGPIT